jgi:hypothetical protein
MTHQRRRTPLNRAGNVAYLCNVAPCRKTLGFLLPILTKVAPIKDNTTGKGGEAAPLALVIAPTRELASQIHVEAEKYCGLVGCSAMTVYGGESRVVTIRAPVFDCYGGWFDTGTWHK